MLAFVRLFVDPSQLVAVPEASSFLGPRSVGVRPWSKPDFYFRSQVRESATFSSSSPGPGEVYSIEQAPGSQTGRVTVCI